MSTAGMTLPHTRVIPRDELAQLCSIWLTNMVNADEYRGFPPGTLRVTNVRGKEMARGTELVWLETLELEYNPDGWNIPHEIYETTVFADCWFARNSQKATQPHR